MSSAWIHFQGKTAEIFSQTVARFSIPDVFLLTAFSALMGVMLVWAYSFVSFQKKLAELKRRIATVALEPFVFSDSARISLFTPLKLCAFACQYLLLSLPPLLILALPVVWILGFWNQVVGYDLIKPKQQVEISISAESSRDIRQLQVSLEGVGYEISPMVRSYHEAQAWVGLRGKDTKPEASLLIKSGDSITRILLQNPPFLPVLTDSNWKRLLFPGSALELPKGIKEISIDYPSRYFEIFGTNISWVVLFLIVSMISGLVFAKLFRIQI